MATIDPVKIDLNGVINGLNKRYDEIRNYILDPNVSDMQQRDQITEWLSSISKDILVLSAIKANSNAASVVVTPPSSNDRTQLLASVNKVNAAIKTNQGFNSFITAVTAALGAADTITANVRGSATKPATKATKPATKSG
jgi:hypothetical protein